MAKAIKSKGEEKTCGITGEIGPMMDSWISSWSVNSFHANEERIEARAIVAE